ncbi:hypothetical protein OG871_28710 [Kitasatospora sp. NBC_00374]|uniref:3-dehydroquinate synthase family protein n=1 Tax=Kitasatospora sp. NBC_00374 TaxID=2975964 RepID=UPI0030DF5079
MAHPTAAVALDRLLQTGGAAVRLLARSGPAARGELARTLATLNADRFLVVAESDPPPEPTAPNALPLRTPAATTLRSVERLAEQALAAGITRRTVVLGVGGPRTSDTAGLLAALVFNGLRLVQVPTTLAAACGPALSLRHTVGSGVLGVWQAPELVFCPLDAITAAGVPAAGAIDAVRSVLAVCPAGYAALDALLRPEGGYRQREAAALIALCADARAAVTGYDPLERGPGRALGYGRTLGRAIGLLTGGALRAGEADGLGMLVAARAAAHLGLLPLADERAHRELLRRAGMPVALPPGVDPADLPGALRLAAGRDGERGLVLLEGLGRPYCADGSLLTEVDERTLRAAADAVRPGGIPRSRRAGVPARCES